MTMCDQNLHNEWRRRIYHLPFMMSSIKMWSGVVYSLSWNVFALLLFIYLFIFILITVYKTTSHCHCNQIINPTPEESRRTNDDDSSNVLALDNHSSLIRIRRQPRTRPFGLVKEIHHTESSTKKKIKKKVLNDLANQRLVGAVGGSKKILDTRAAKYWLFCP